MQKDTSWEKVADWYDALLEGEGTYQKELILPNLLRLMAIRKNEQVLDLACGQGFFAREFARAGGRVIAADASRALVEHARKNPTREIEYHVAPAHRLDFLKEGSIDQIAIVLALQNIENAGEVLAECGRVLKAGGRLHLVLNHPAFRIPKASAWGWDEAQKIQYRRIDRYLSESKVRIQMHPGDAPQAHTLSFHRPLQFYFKALRKAGFAVTALEEWNSHKKSGPGPRARAENAIRREIPLFLYLAANKV